MSYLGWTRISGPSYEWFPLSTLVSRGYVSSHRLNGVLLAAGAHDTAEAAMSHFELIRLGMQGRGMNPQPNPPSGPIVKGQKAGEIGIVHRIGNVVGYFVFFHPPANYEAGMTIVLADGEFERRVTGR
jgi:hypothetical protein